MRMTWIRRVLVPLAVLLVLLGVIFRLFGIELFGISAESYIGMANTIFLFVIVILLIRIEGKTEVL